MKTKIIFPLLVALSILLSCSQTVPKVVSDAFTNKFLGARDIVWQKRPKHDWMATFYMERFHYMTAYYTPTGAFEAFEIKIHDADIPKNLVDEIRKNYPKATIYEVFELNTEHTTEYIFEIVDKGELFGIHFNEQGLSRIIPANDYRFISRIRVEND
jgi:hypothetical protein